MLKYIDSGYRPISDLTSMTLNASRLNGSQLQREDSKKNKKLYVDAIVYYKKLSMKSYLPVNAILISNLKADLMRLNLEELNQKEMLILSKIFGKYFYFKQIQITPNDPQKSHNEEAKKKKFTDGKSSVQKEEIEKKEKIKDLFAKICMISTGLGKTLKSEESCLEILKFVNIDFGIDWVVSLSDVNNLTFI